ncbi:MAG: D-alanyl-D-alanine carboxypeptidase family protein [Prochlorococcus sp.]
MARAVSARRIGRDDIPVARRSRPQRRAKGGSTGLLVVCLIVFAGSITTVVFGQRMFAWLMVPAPVEGIQARPAADGRLLGHFEYPEASAQKLITIQPGLELHQDAAEALMAMRAAAFADGIDLSLLSGFRSHDLQKWIFFEVKSDRNQTAAERAKVSAPPGYSEHSTGYAVDIGDAAVPEADLSVSFESTRAFRWLEDNAARYHFVLSFPPDNQQGVTYEPWHWRFEGSASALQLFEAARQFPAAH